MCGEKALPGEDYCKKHLPYRVRCGSGACSNYDKDATSYCSKWCFLPFLWSSTFGSNGGYQKIRKRRGWDRRRLPENESGVRSGDRPLDRLRLEAEKKDN